MDSQNDSQTWTLVGSCSLSDSLFDAELVGASVQPDAGRRFSDASDESFPSLSFSASADGSSPDYSLPPTPATDPRGWVNVHRDAPNDTTTSNCIPYGLHCTPQPPPFTLVQRPLWPYQQQSLSPVYPFNNPEHVDQKSFGGSEYNYDRYLNSSLSIDGALKSNTATNCIISKSPEICLESQCVNVTAESPDDDYNTSQEQSRESRPRRRHHTPSRRRVKSGSTRKSSREASALKRGVLHCYEGRDETKSRKFRCSFTDEPTREKKCKNPECIRKGISFQREEHLRRHERQHSHPKRIFTCAVTSLFGGHVCDKRPIHDRGDNLNQHHTTHVYGLSTGQSRNAEFSMPVVKAIMWRAVSFDDSGPATDEQRRERIRSVEKHVGKKSSERMSNLNGRPKWNGHISHESMRNLLPDGFVCCEGIVGCPEQLPDWYRECNDLPWCCCWYKNGPKEGFHEISLMSD